jgi:dipeptidyl-peptidase-4
MRFVVFCVLISLTIPVFAQKTLSLEEVFSKPELNPKSLKNLQWLPDSHDYCWISDAGNLLLKSSVHQAKIDTLLKSNELVEGMLTFPPLNFDTSTDFGFIFQSYYYKANINNKAIQQKLKLNEEAENIDIASKTYNLAYTVGSNLVVQNFEKTIQINTESDPGILYGQAVHRNEFGIEKGTFWSNSGSKVAFYRMDQRMVTDYPIVHIDKIPAESKPIKYPMAGGLSHQVTVGVFDVSTGKIMYIQTGLPAEQYLTNISWSPDDRFILIAVVNREQNQMKLNQYSAIDGKYVKTLRTEIDAEWVEPEHPLEFLPGSNDQFVYQSEKNGYNQLYLGKLSDTSEIQLTNGNSVVTDFLGFDKSGKKAFAVVTDKNGLDRQLVRFNLKGKLTRLTNLSGTHGVQLCEDKSLFIDNFSSIHVPRKISINSTASGKETKQLLSVSNPLDGFKMSIPELTELKTSNGITLNARVFKPSKMEAGKKYPVIIYVYGGPHAQMVTNRWLAGGNLWMSWMAEQGYIVFTLDNRGSANRGLDFEQAVHRKLGTVEMEDQLAGVSYLKSLPCVDATRIGVHGWSFGGFMTTTLLCKNPGMFKAGVAGGPVIDWKLYEVMYTERYMDTPLENPEGYETANLLNAANNLKDRLMLIHGTVDDVVVWQHSQEFIKKCVDSGVLVEYMIYPEHPHNVSGKDRLHLIKTITRYFQEHL